MGLHGAFNDSLPDGWGKLLLDRRLQKAGLDYRLLTPIDRLAYVGRKGVGALRYAPGENFNHSPSTDIDLDKIANEVAVVQNEIDDVDVDLLQNIQGGSAGARPKIMIGLNKQTQKITADVGEGLAAGMQSWMVKFKSNFDNEEIGAEEYAYSLMAKDAGIKMPETRLIQTKSGSYFAVERFDRTAKGCVHVQTASGLVEADHRMPSIDYKTLLKITRTLTRDERDVHQMFRRMVFNVLARNRDDHAKNHAFILDTEGAWHPSPAYDLTLSDGPGGEHSLAVAGE